MSGRHPRSRGDTPGRRRWLAQAAALIGAGSPWPAATVSAAPTDWWAQWSAGALRGFTTQNLPELDAPTLTALRDTGASAARVGLHFRRSGTDYALQAADATALHACLQQAQQIGLGLVVLGLFDDGVDPQPLWHDAALQRSWLRAWSEFASRFGRHPALAAVDLLNEPHAAHLPLNVAQSVWLTWAGAATAAMRRAGSEAPVVVESLLGAHPSALRGWRPLADPRVLYSVHFYTPHDITHQRVSGQWPRRIPYPAGREWQLGAWDAELGAGPIDRARLWQELRFVREFQALHRRPVYVGEFGCARWAPSDSALRWAGDCVELFNAAAWNWTFHSFRGWNGWDAEIESADPAVRVRRSDAPMMRRLRAALAAPAGPALSTR